MNHASRLWECCGPVEVDGAPIPFGAARVVRAGEDATVVALSNMVDEAVAAADVLAGKGISAEVIDPRTIAPLDLETILGSLRKTMRLVVTHDAHKTGGFGAELAALCWEHAFDYLDAPVERVCGLDVPVPSGKELEEVYPSVDAIVAAVERVCEGTRA